MEIKELSDDDEPKYNELALSYGSIFNTIDWTNIFGEKVKLYGIYDDGGNLIGGFHTFCEKRFSFSIYLNTPFAPEIGPFLKVDAQKPVSVMDTWKKALSSMSNFFDDLPYSIISFSLNNNIIDTQPFFWKKFKVIPSYTYIINLRKSIADIWKGLSSNHRSHINKATKDGLIVKQIKDMNIVKCLILKTYAKPKQDKKVKEFYLDKILFNFSTDENSYAFGAFKKDKPISAAFFVYDKHTSYLLASGYDYENKHHGAGMLTKWEGIKYAKKLDLNYFDFEGSMVPRIEKFNRGFGGQLKPYYSINKAKLPIEMLLKLFKRELF